MRGLPLTYELRRISRREFDQRYEAAFPRPERPTAALSWERGRETLWEHVLACYALLCARGQHCRTTNGQRGQALSSRGRPRCRRTLQRYSRKLERLGLATVLHVRKPPGQRDCLAIEWHVTRRVRGLHVTPPSGTGNPGLRPGGCRPQSTATDSLPPPTAADETPPAAPAERPASREGELEAQIQFQQLKLSIGFGEPGLIRRELDRLEAQLGQERARIASTTSEGFRCST